MKYLFLVFSFILLIHCNEELEQCNNNDKKQTLSFQKIPDELNIIFDLNEAKKCSKKRKQDILVLFTRYSGQSETPPLEWKLIISTKMIKEINGNYVFTCLLVDDRSLLPDNEIVYSAQKNEQVKRYGQKWTNFQLETTGLNFQPVFVKYSPDKLKVEGIFTEIMNKDGFVRFIKNNK